jgi:hypothetical protein
MIRVRHHCRGPRARGSRGSLRPQPPALRPEHSGVVVVLPREAVVVATAEQHHPPAVRGHPGAARGDFFGCCCSQVTPSHSHVSADMVCAAKRLNLAGLRCDNRPTVASRSLAPGITAVVRCLVLALRSARRTVSQLDREARSRCRLRALDPAAPIILASVARRVPELVPRFIAAEDHRIEADSAERPQPCLCGCQQRSCNALAPVVGMHS